AAEKRRQQRRAAEKRRQRTLASLEQKFEQAYTAGEYAEAERQLQAMADAGLEASRYQNLQQRLKKASNEEAAKHFELGVSAYSRGQFEKAAGHWRQTLALQPDNKQAQEHLERAERVLKKLEELKQKQG
ncbi:MAG: hypothetical protein ACQETD_11785, partial [Pseudomonadota bacterium]